MYNNIIGDVMLMKEIPLEERPRERIIKYGPSKLSNEELLSIILRCGTRNKSVKELSRDILKEFNGLNNLKSSTINRLNNINGMGVSKSTIILATIELGKRIYLDNNNRKVVLKNPKSIFEYTIFV